MSKQTVVKICRHNDDLVAGAAFRDGEGKFITERYLEKAELPTEVSSFNNDAGYLTEHQSLKNYATKDELDKKQDDLISGTNIKTINGHSILGKGNLDISGGGGEADPIYQVAVDDDGVTDDTILKITDTLSYRSNPSEDFKPVKVDTTGLATENWVEDKHYLTEHQSLEEYLKSSEAEETYQSKGEYLTEETDPTVPAWAKEENKPTYTASEVGALPDTTIIPEVPENVSAFNNDVGYLTEHQSLDGYLKSNDAEEKYQPKGEYLTKETDPTVPAWAKEENKPSYTAEEVGALPDTTIIPEVPENVSAFTNDAGYLTEHQDISGKYDKSGGEISGNVKIDGWLQMKIEDEDYNAGIQFTPRLDDNLGTVLTLTGYAHGQEQTYYKTLLRNIKEPAAADDAATKGYVDNKVNTTWISGFDNEDGTLLLSSTAYNDAYNAVISNHTCYIKVTATDRIYILKLKDWVNYNGHKAGEDIFIFAEDTDEQYKRIVKLYKDKNEYLVVDYSSEFELHTNKTKEITEETIQNENLFPTVGAITQFIIEHFTPKPVLLYDAINDYIGSGELVEGTYSSGAGLNSQNQGEGATNPAVTSWNIINADYSDFNYLRITYKRNSKGAATTGTFLMPLNVEPTELGQYYATGSNLAYGDRNRFNVCGAAVDGDKTKFSMTQAFSLYGTAVTAINNIRICKIEGIY